MALIASDLTTQVILALISFIFLYGGGFIQKLAGIGLAMTGLGLAATSQSYVSDLTSTPTNVFLFFPANLQTAWVILFSLMTIVGLSFTFLNLRKLIELSNVPVDESEFQRKKRMEAFYEELV